MRPKTGLPKRKALRTKPVYQYGFRENPETASYRNTDEESSTSSARYSVVSFFSGCGGLDLGFLGGFRILNKLYAKRRFEILKAIDNDAKSIETYKLNIGSHADVADLTAIDQSALPSADVLIGGFPCQDFSSSGPKTGLEGKRGRLYRCMVEYMATHRPKVVIAENVPHLLRLNKGANIKVILQELEQVGYKFQIWELYAPDYGVPQSRRRLFLVGKRDDLDGEIYPPRPTCEGRPVTIDEALDDLVSVTDEKVTNQGQYFVATKATAGGGQGDHKNEKGTVAYCIRANAKARIQFHYELDRRLTVRECARLQTFPDQFVFPSSAMINMSQIGNAVPPVLAHYVASSVEDFLAGKKTARRNIDQKLVVPRPAQGDLIF
jgi:DNA (cytosine-5)-methyltransferase 1